MTQIKANYWINFFQIFYGIQICIDQLKLILFFNSLKLQINFMQQTLFITVHYLMFSIYLIQSYDYNNQIFKYDDKNTSCCQNHKEQIKKVGNKMKIIGKIQLLDQLFSIIQAMIERVSNRFFETCCKTLITNCSMCIKKKILHLIEKMLKMHKHQSLFINELNEKKPYLYVISYLKKKQSNEFIQEFLGILNQFLGIKLIVIKKNDLIELFSKTLFKQENTDHIDNFEVKQKQQTQKIEETNQNQQESPVKMQIEKNKLNFQLDIPSIQQQMAKQQSSLQLTYPQAPSMINRRKVNEKGKVFSFEESIEPPPLGKKDKINFGFEQNREKINEIQQFKHKSLQKKLKIQQKKQPIQFLFETPIKKDKKQKPEKKKPNLLMIDIQQINKLHNYGGQHGRKIIIDFNQYQAQLLEIQQLTNICLSYMRGQIKEEQQQLGILKRPQKMQFKSSLENKGDKKKSLSIFQPLPSSRASKQLIFKSKNIFQPKKVNVNKLSEHVIDYVFNKLINEELKEFKSIRIINIQFLPIVFKVHNSCCSYQDKFLKFYQQLVQQQSNIQILGCCQQFYYQFICKINQYIEALLKGNDIKIVDNLIRITLIFKIVIKQQFRKNNQAYKHVQKILAWKIKNKVQNKSIIITSRFLWQKYIEALKEVTKQHDINRKLVTINVIYTVILTQQLIFSLHLIKINNKNNDSPVSKLRHYLTFIGEPFEIQGYFSLSKWVDSEIIKNIIQLSKFCEGSIIIKFRNIFKQNDQQLLIRFIQLHLQYNLSQQLCKIYQFYIEKEQFIYRGSFLKSLLRLQTTYFDQMISAYGNIKIEQLHECLQELIVYSSLLLLILENGRSKLIYQNKNTLFALFFFIVTFLYNRAKQSSTEVQLFLQKGLIKIYKIIQFIVQVLQNKGLLYQTFHQFKKRYFNNNYNNMLVYQLISQYIADNQGNRILIPDSKYFRNHLSNNKIVSLVNQKFCKPFQPIPLPRKQQLNLTYIDNLINNFSSEIQNQLDKKLHNALILNEQSRRIGKNKWKKIWRSINVYEKQYKKWEKIRLAKQQTKSRARVFLKYKLQQPQYAQQYVIRLTDIAKQMPLSPILHYAMKKQEQIKVDKQQQNVTKLGMLYNLGKSIIKTVIPLRNKSEQIIFRKVEWVTTLTIRTGSLIITASKLLFFYSNIEMPINHKAMVNHILKDDRRLVNEWQLEYIKFIYRRRYVSRHTAIELLFLDGNTLFLNFTNKNDSQSFQKTIIKYNKIRIPNLVYFKTLNPSKLIETNKMTTKWVNNQISNFNYLMHLNTLAGRSYKDLSQYPVFPWVISNYDKEFDLKNHKHYRDLSKSMGNLGSIQRCQLYKEKFQNPDIYTNCLNFHFGSHYSSPVRLSPFTEGAKALQGGQFDTADRLFNSVKQAYKCATTQIADVKQLIPEFYYLPEIFLNISDLDLGINCQKQKINDVLLPEWSKSAFHFVCTMRRALQSPIVSCTLNNWIDLIFGYKQKGKEAEQNLNVFYFLTYEDAIDLDNLEQDMNLESTQSQIINFGQTPSQIFSKAHQRRLLAQQIQNGRVITDSKAQIRLYKPTGRANRHTNNQQLNVMKMGQNNILKIKWIYNQKMILCIKRNGKVSFYPFQRQQSYNSKVPFRLLIAKEFQVKQVSKTKCKYPQPDKFNCCYDPCLNVTHFPIQVINHGQLIILGGLVNGKMLLINIQHDFIIEQYRNHKQTISFICSDGKDNFLITGDLQGTVILWRIQAQHKVKPYKIYHDHIGKVNFIFYSKQLRCFCSAGVDGNVFIYNCFSGKRMATLNHPNQKSVDEVIYFNEVLLLSNPLASSILLNYQQKTIYSISINGYLLQTLKENEYDFIGHMGVLTDMEFQEWIFYSTGNGKLIIRDSPFMTNNRKIYVYEKGFCSSTISSADMRYIITGSKQGQIAVLTDPSRIH